MNAHQCSNLQGFRLISVGSTVVQMAHCYSRMCGSTLATVLYTKSYGSSCCCCVGVYYGKVMRLLSASLPMNNWRIQVAILSSIAAIYER